jgi:hypothetical protein
MISSVGIVLRDPSLGGTERTAARLGRAWSNVGVDVTFYHGQPDGPMRALIGGDQRVVPLHWPMPAGTRSDPRMGLTVAELLAAQPVHAILIPGINQWPVARLLSRLPREQRPVIVARTGTGLCAPRRAPGKRFFHDLQMRRFLGEIDGLVVPSDVAAARACRILANGPAVRAIATPPLDDDVARPLRNDDLDTNGGAGDRADADSVSPHRFGDVALAYLDFFGTLRTRRRR